MTAKNRRVEELCHALLLQIGEDPNREGLQETPARFARAMNELTEGYNLSSDEIVNDALYPSTGSQMIVLKDIEFYSMCEHHLLPFFGRAHVAYIPNGKIIGISKIPRIVNLFARRLQLQEKLTDQIAAELNRIIAPAGIACAIEANHMCMMMRGVRIQSSSMITSSLHGVFLSDKSARDEFMSLIRGDSKVR